MHKIINVLDNPNFLTVESMGAFTLIEHQVDFYDSEGYSDTKKMQLIGDINKSPIATQAQCVQWTVGEIVVTPPGKKTGRDVTAKVEYDGSGYLITKATEDHMFLLDMKDWNEQLLVDDTYFVACEAALRQKLMPRNTLSSAVSGGKGQFNFALAGKGIVCLKTPVSVDALTTIVLEKDMLRVEENRLVAWSASLIFNVEASGESASGSSGGGFVHVLRGSGRALLLP